MGSAAAVLRAAVLAAQAVVRAVPVDLAARAVQWDPEVRVGRVRQAVHRDEVRMAGRIMTRNATAVPLAQPGAGGTTSPL